MNHKVLLADDSLTIQKVIKITLANQPFQIFDCTTDDDLFKKLGEVKPALVFLDFNLSEKYTGYELTAKIKQASPETRVLLLLGTFDTVDDAAMEKCGASEKIVKPFDSNKFIAICKRLVDTAPLVEEIHYPEPKKEPTPEPKVEDQWQVSHTIEQKPAPVEPSSDASTKNFDVRQHLNPLDLEASDWGMSVPGIISDKDVSSAKATRPSVIGGELHTLDSARAKSEAKPQVTEAKEDFKYPQTDDLDYPTIEQLEAKAPTPAPEKKEPVSKLLSIDTFNQSPIEFEIEHTINSVEESDISSIEAQIRDEVEEDLWKADEFEDLKNEVSAKIEEVKNNFKPSERDFDESLFKPLDDDQTISWATPSHADLEFPSVTETTQEIAARSLPAAASSIDSHAIMNQLRSEVDEMVKKHVKEYMDQMFQQKVEKISWEVIPDLAENLIRQEISKISNKILNDSN